MQEASTRKIYDVHAMFYDATFGRLVRRRIARAVSHMPIRPADVILDLGIGTGVSLDYYPPDRGRIIGVDLSSGTPEAMVDSLDRLRRLDDTLGVYPGHGPATSIGRERGWLDWIAREGRLPT